MAASRSHVAGTVPGLSGAEGRRRALAKRAKKSEVAYVEKAMRWQQPPAATPAPPPPPPENCMFRSVAKAPPPPPKARSHRYCQHKAKARKLLAEMNDLNNCLFDMVEAGPQDLADMVNQSLAAKGWRLTARPRKA